MLVLDVSGMKGEACAKKAQEALSAADPDATVVPSQHAGRVSLDASLTAEEAVDAVTSAGCRAVFAFVA